ncbi:MAG: hypothetical protein VB078_01915 [Clostridiaceae bacterium]|nr:hypothetical protein [Clostridiaceae bacterium]
MKRRGLNVFLTETVIMSCVFAIAVALCLGVFLKASAMRTEASDISKCSGLVYSAGQCYLATGSISETEKLMQSEDTGKYSLIFTDKDDFIVISALKGDKEIFSSPVKAVSP